MARPYDALTALRFFGSGCFTFLHTPSACDEWSEERRVGLGPWLRKEIIRERDNDVGVLRFLWGSNQELRALEDRVTRSDEVQHALRSSPHRDTWRSIKSFRESVDMRGAELVGLRVSIRWTGDRGKPWFSGRIAEWRPTNETHLIVYDDGDAKAHNLKEEEDAGQLRWLTPPDSKPAAGKRTATVKQEQPAVAKKVKKEETKDAKDVKTEEKSVKSEASGSGKRAAATSKVKTEETKAVKREDKPADAAGSNKRGKAKMEVGTANLAPKPVLVEFKFRSCKSFCVKPGEWNGVLHVPMMQDPLTGRCVVQSGTTVVKGTVHRTDAVYDQMQRWENEDEDEPVRESITETFVAKFTREAGKPLHNFELGYDICYMNEEFGVYWDVVEARVKHHHDDDHVDVRSPFATIPHNKGLGFGPGEFKVKGPKAPPSDASDDDDVSEGGYSFVAGDERTFRRHLDEWERHAGGILQVYARAFLDGDFDLPHPVLDADYKIKLYTVLSCHAPNETGPLKREKGAGADWGALERVLAARFPKKPKSWAAKAVEQYQPRAHTVHALPTAAVHLLTLCRALCVCCRYQLFLELKIQHDDWDSTLFSPSAMLDEVWHAHLAFVPRYQRDILALTNGARLLEHSPVLGDDARERYAACHKAHVTKMRIAKQPVDKEFWPAPNASAMRKDEEHDGDSDDHMSYGEGAGGPSCG